jgi:hypothetical protein
MKSMTSMTFIAAAKLSSGTCVDALPQFGSARFGPARPGPA